MIIDMDKVIKEFEKIEGRLFIFDGQNFITGKKLHDMGIYVCSECGYLISLERKYCKDCNSESIMLLQKEENFGT